MNQLEKDFHAEFPELVYVGDGKSQLPGDFRGLIPDFLVPESRKVIELFGDYWHAGEDPELRIRKIRAFGYEAIVVWESDFRKCPEETIARVQQFVSDNRMR